MSPVIFILLTPFIADDMSAAAHELAREVASLAAPEPVAVTVKNRSSLGAAETAEVRRVFESDLKTPAGPSTLDVQIAISENLTQFLLVAEIDRHGDRQVLLASWPRVPGLHAASQQDQAPRVTLEKKLLWEQDLPILDAIQTGGALLVLDSTRVLLVRGGERLSAPISATHPWPRDMRGRLSAGDGAFTAYLPGTICRGSTTPQLSLDCRDSQDPWLLAPGALAFFAPDRNLFPGHIDVAPGGTLELPPFYSAATAGDVWFLASADGRAHIFTRSWEAAGVMEKWGSDIAAIQTPCGPRVLAARASALTEPDAIEAYEIVDSAANTAGPALEFSGPVTALWSAGSSATAVSHDLQTGRYAAFSLVPACGS